MYFLADASSVIPDPQTFDYSKEIINMLLSLGSLLAIVISIGWFLKRFLSKRMELSNQSNKIKIVERRALSPKASLYLIEISGKKFVIGESAAGLTSLGECPTESLGKEALQEIKKENLSFADILKNKFIKTSTLSEKT